METKLIQKTEKIDNQSLDVLQKNNRIIDDILHNIGSIHIRRKELENELGMIESRLIQLEDEFVEANTEITKCLKKLETVYKSGKIDLRGGTVTYQSEVR
jgi:hypothetical protein